MWFYKGFHYDIERSFSLKRMTFNLLKSDERSYNVTLKITLKTDHCYKFHQGHGTFMERFTSITARSSQNVSKRFLLAYHSPACFTSYVMLVCSVCGGFQFKLKQIKNEINIKISDSSEPSQLEEPSVAMATTDSIVNMDAAAAAADPVIAFHTYEEFLDSQITQTDIYYLEVQLYI